jgi:hypothetical protein
MTDPNRVEVIRMMKNTNIDDATIADAMDTDIEMIEREYTTS